MKRSLKTEIRPNKHHIRYFRLCCQATKMVYNWAIAFHNEQENAFMDRLEARARAEGFVGDWNWNTLKEHKALWINSYMEANDLDKHNSKLRKQASVELGLSSPSPTRDALTKALTQAVKANDPAFATDWCPNVVALVHANIRTNTLERFENAYKKAFAKQGGRPKFKRFVDSFTTTMTVSNEGRGYPDLVLNSETIELNGRERTRAKIKIPGSTKAKLAPIAIKEHDYPTGRISRVTISTKSGRWFISPLFDKIIERDRPTKDAAGVDLNIGSFDVVEITGAVHPVPTPQPLKCAMVKLKWLDRRMSRCVKGSCKYRRLKQRRAKLHMRVANIRGRWLHDLVNWLLQFKTIYIEDLDVKGIQESKLKANALDIGFGRFRRILSAKCNEAGIELYAVDRYYPSSQLCPACDKKTKHTLQQRTFTCQYCGYQAPRDSVAGWNLVRLHTPEHRPIGYGQLGKCLPRCAGKVTARERIVPETISLNAQAPLIFPIRNTPKANDHKDL